MGECLSVDDFGTGHSSLAYLQRLPIDQLKVDRSFVQHLATVPTDAVIVRSTIDLAHNLGLSVVAEGVEDQAGLDTLVEYGCDVAQGYFFSRPMTADALTDWLRRSAYGATPAPRRPAPIHFAGGRAVRSDEGVVGFGEDGPQREDGLGVDLARPGL
jgi:sensor c-di-GMP phosphodiesterase-like protein